MDNIRQDIVDVERLRGLASGDDVAKHGGLGTIIGTLARECLRQHDEIKRLRLLVERVPEDMSGL